MRTSYGTVVVLGAAELVGVTHKAFGSLFLLCGAAGSLTAGILDGRERDRARGRSRAHLA